ncbi:PQQ-dependent sugar dehydrogenase [Massilia niastensis]|uniref:PQQ-dependent sugar dehydrogenase n=1 Tax=Massilia niastensis TaxID=544911 RepID=UPI00039E9FF8|nr:PQQ-dependent sugar dehydrogenase [Massilia niastensis]
MLIQAVAGIAAAAAYAQTSAPPPVPLADPIPALISQSQVKLDLEPVMSGLVSPVAAAVAPGDRRHLYVADQTGQLWRVPIAGRDDDDRDDHDHDDDDRDDDHKGRDHRDKDRDHKDRDHKDRDRDHRDKDKEHRGDYHKGDDRKGDGRKDDDRKGDHDGASRQPRLFLDVSSLLVPLGLGERRFDERGLLGIAFHPQFKYNGLFYTFTSQPVKGKADFSTMPQGVAPNCHSVITEWRVKHPGKRNSEVDLASARELLRIDKPQFNHNGGAIAFGHDQMLYISVGDGGAADDEGMGHVAGGNAQSLAPGNVLGKILRLDPLGRNSANGKYGIPPDNPFVGKMGADEIFAYGFRNPFRMSFDPYGRLIVGDVGQNAIEEVDIVMAGGNYGWRIKEGTFLFNTAGPNAPGFVFENSPGLPPNLVDPIAQYDHADGPGQDPKRVAVIGGYVYRGHKLDQLRGQYVFGDYSGSGGATPNGHLFVLGRNNRVEHVVPTRPNPFTLAVLGFGQDARGELYLLANGTGTLLGKTGVVMKFVPAKRH